MAFDFTCLTTFQAKSNSSKAVGSSYPLPVFRKTRFISASCRRNPPPMHFISYSFLPCFSEEPAPASWAFPEIIPMPGIIIRCNNRLKENVFHFSATALSPFGSMPQCRQKQKPGQQPELSQRQLPGWHQWPPHKGWHV